MVSSSLASFLLFFVVCCPLGVSNIITQSQAWELDAVVSDTVAAGSYGETFRVTLPVDNDGNINFGVLRIDVNQTSDTAANFGRSVLYLSTSLQHFQSGVGPSWPVPRYTWAVSSSGTVGITRCETDPMSEALFVQKNNEPVGKEIQHSAGKIAKAGYLVEETSSTTAFCLPKAQHLNSLPVSQRVGADASAKDAPNAACRCLGAAGSRTKYLYARARCYGTPGTTPACSFTASVSTTCPLGTAPDDAGACRLCEVDGNKKNAASVVVATISGSGNTIASAQCLAQTTCPAGTFYVERGKVTREAMDSYIPKSLTSGKKAGRRLNTNTIEVGQCEPCSQPYFSTTNSIECEYTIKTCPAGTYADWSSQACLSCPPGTWSSSVGSTSLFVCQACDQGKFSAIAGGTSSSDCLGCIPDTYSDETASASCKACPDGMLTLGVRSRDKSGLGFDAIEDIFKVIKAPTGEAFPEEECRRACREQSPCNTGEESNQCCKSYEVSTDGKACRIAPCPTDGICNPDPNAAPECIGCLNSKYFLQKNCYESCPPGYTGIENADSGRQCFEAHNATTATDSKIKEENNDHPHRCRSLCELGEHYTEAEVCIKCEGGTEWCIGTWECLGNRTADGCVKCLPGYYEVRQVCTVCPEDAVVSLIIVLVILVLLLSLLFIFAGSSRPETSLSGLMIFLGHIQIQGYLLKFDVNWPPEFVWFMRVLSSIFTLDLPSIVPAPECSFNWGTESKYFSSMAAMPFLLMLCWFPVLLAFVYVACCKCKGCILCRKKIKNKMCSATELSTVHKAVAVSTIILSIMYGFVSPASTELGLCKQREGDTFKDDAGQTVTRAYLRSDPSVECVWHHYFLATCFGILYSLGIPFCIALFLYWGKNTKKLWDEEHWIPDHVGWIYLRFEHSVFWWELVNMVTKTIIGVTERAGAGAGDEGRTIQLVIAFIVLTISLGLQIYFRPYASMLERADIIHTPYTFTVRGGKKGHGVHLEPMGSNELGIYIKYVDEDAKFAPVADDLFSDHRKSDKEHPVAHCMRMGDIITHIDGLRLPHVYGHRKKRTLAEMLHIKKDHTTIESQVRTMFFFFFE